MHPQLPLLVTADDGLLDDLLRLAAAAGVSLDVAADPGAGRAAWGGAPLVLVGADLAAGLAATAPPRRSRVLVVTTGPVGDPVFRHALAVGAESVVELPAADTWLVEMLGDVAEGPAHQALTVAVIGGCGGAGASTFAAALARTASQPQAPGLLMDLDPLGGGLERIVGLDDADGVRWDSLLGSSGRLGSRSLRAALPQVDGLSVLGCGPRSRFRLDTQAVREVLAAAQRGHDTVVVDLPRYVHGAAQEVLTRVDHVLVVSGLGLMEVAACGRTVTALIEAGARGHLVARTKGVAADPADVADLLGVPLLVAMGEQRRLAESIGLGLGPVHHRRGQLARAAREVWSRLRGMPSTAPDRVVPAVPTLGGPR
jgi:secretion/DNA translocation related CpaE-like protein